jgi:hypothetical protein
MVQFSVSCTLRGLSVVLKLNTYLQFTLLYKQYHFCNNLTQTRCSSAHELSPTVLQLTYHMAKSLTAPEKISHLQNHFMPYELTYAE